MNTEIYLAKRTYERFDNSHYLVFLNEKIVEDYIPDNHDREQSSEPVTAYSYTGPQKDGGTIIECVDDSRDSLINGIIRSKYSQSEEDAIKTHQIIGLTEVLEEQKKKEYDDEWKEFNGFREFAKLVVDRWLIE